MAHPLNLLARENFKQGEQGYVLGEGVRLGDGVRKVTGTGVPHGAIRLTALDDIKAGAHGHFQEAASPQRPAKPVELDERTDLK
jgi:hypothetical protein